MIATCPELDPRIRVRLRDAIAHGTLQVPPLSDAVAQLLAEARKPEADTRHLADIIRRDPALAGNLLWLANSTTYVGREPATTLDQAIQRLGTTALRDLALVIATRARAFRVVGYEHEMRELFAHAFASALYGQEVARVRRRGGGEAFLAGLFHDVGRPIVLQLALDLHAAVGLTAPPRVLAWAAETLHAEAGARAIEVWHLGKPLADAVRYHHDFVGDPSRRLAAQAALASALAQFALAGAARDEADDDDGDGAHELAAELAVYEHPAVAALELQPDEIAGLLASAPRIAEHVAAMA